MKGLLLKDLYAIKTYLRAYIFLDIILILASGISVESNFMMFYPCMISGLVTMTLLAYEEKDKWEIYALTLPYTRAQLVSSKYLLSLLISMMNIVGICLMQMGNLRNFAAFAGTLCTLILLSVLPTALLLPFLYKLGVEKGRLCYYVIIGLFCALIPILNTSKALEGGVQAPTVLIGSPLVGTVVLAASALIFALSWRLSIRFYQKREF